MGNTPSSGPRLPVLRPHVYPQTVDEIMTSPAIRSIPSDLDSGLKTLPGGRKLLQGNFEFPDDFAVVDWDKFFEDDADDMHGRSLKQKNSGDGSTSYPQAVPLKHPWISENNRKLIVDAMFQSIKVIQTLEKNLEDDELNEEVVKYYEVYWNPLMAKMNTFADINSQSRQSFVSSSLDPVKKLALRAKNFGNALLNGAGYADNKIILSEKEFVGSVEEIRALTSNIHEIKVAVLNSPENDIGSNKFISFQLEEFVKDVAENYLTKMKGAGDQRIDVAIVIALRDTLRALHHYSLGVAQNYGIDD